MSKTRTLTNISSQMQKWFSLLMLLGITFCGWSQESTNGPYVFVVNEGQWDSQIKYRTDIPSGALFLEGDRFTYHFYDAQVLHDLHHTPNAEADKKLKIRHHAFQLLFNGASNELIFAEKNQVRQHFNYYLGKDRSKWASHVPGFNSVQYQGLYPKIDLMLYNAPDGQLKYDFILEPGADHKQIRMVYQGVDKLKIKDGQLILKTSLGEIIEEAPIAYQMINGVRKGVNCEFALSGNEVSFVFPDGYDQDYTLVIDPALIFSTYSGSFANNFGYTATFDDKGYLYAGSTAFGVNYPTTLGAYDESFNGGTVDIAITKYDTNGTSLIYSTYIGGGSDELPHSLIVNDQEELYLFGTTSSLNYPTTTGAYDTTMATGPGVNLTNGLGVNFTNGADLIVSRFNADGDDLLSSTYIGRSGADGLNTAPDLKYNYADEVRGEVMIDQTGDIYVVSCTRSTDFPMVGNPFQPSYSGGLQEGVIIKLDADLTQIIWSSFLGGSTEDAIYTIAIDDNNDLYVTGGTNSSDFPDVGTVISNQYGGGRADGFISYISSNGQSLIRSTFFGSTAAYDQNYFVETDRNGFVYVFGQTEATGSAYIQNALYGTPSSGQYVTKINPLLDQIIWSTAFGTGSGAPNISPTAFLVDLCNSVYLSGWGGTTNNLITNNAGNVTGMDFTLDAYQSSPDPSGSDFYLMVLKDDASDISYGSFYGGAQSAEHVDGGTSRFDRKGRIYQSVCAGCGGFDDFPIEPNPGAVSAVNNANCNNGVFKMDFQLPLIVAEFEAPIIGCAPFSAAMINNSLEQGNSSYIWDFGDGNTSTLPNPTHVYDSSGIFTITLIINDPQSCNLSDTAIQVITILSDTNYAIDSIVVCNGEGEQIGIDPINLPGLTYTWVPATGLDDPTIANPIANPNANITYTLVVDNGLCQDTITQDVIVSSASVTTDNDTIVCSNTGSFTIAANSGGQAISFLWSNDNQFSDTLNNFPLDSVTTILPSEPLSYYYVQITNALGCMAIDSLLVTISDQAIGIVGPDSICYDDTVTLSVVSGNPLDTYDLHWTPEPFILSDPNAPSILVHPQQDITYYVEGQNDINCFYSDSISLSVSNLRPVDVSASIDRDTILLGESTTLRGTPETGYLLNWSPSSGLNDPSIANPTAGPSEDTRYTLFVTDPNHLDCIVTDTVFLKVIEVRCGDPEIFIPNAFSPNGDGNNDVLLVRGNYIDQIDFKVYDRWGEKVFETQDQSVGWDGVFKGKLLGPTVFNYYLEVTCADQQQYFKKGNVTLIR